MTTFEEALASPLRRRSVILATGAWAATQAMAQPAWDPSRPIKLVVTYPPGGGADVTARAIVERLGEKLGQPVIVENRGGADGKIGAGFVYRAPPDGYTLLWGNADILTVAPNLFTSLPYEPREFVAVGPTAAVSFMLVGRPELGAKTLPELVALARGKELSFAHWGNGSRGHLGAEMFRHVAKVPKLLVVPYQGTAPAVQALVGGHVDAMFMTSPLWLTTRTRVTTYAAAARTRYEPFKDVPTMTELGVPVELEVWQGLFAPPRTPRPVVDRLSRALQDVMGDATVKKKVEELGGLPIAGGADEFAASVAADQVRWKEFMQAANIQPQS